MVPRPRAEPIQQLLSPLSVALLAHAASVSASGEYNGAQARLVLQDGNESADSQCNRSMNMAVNSS